MVRYSFPVGLLHPLLPAGLSRRFRSVPQRPFILAKRIEPPTSKEPRARHAVAPTLPLGSATLVRVPAILSRTVAARGARILHPRLLPCLEVTPLNARLRPLNA